MAPIQPNLKRSSPLIYGVQEAYQINPVDGLYGQKTKVAIQEIGQIDIKKIKLEYLIMEIIGCFEMGPFHKNLFYATSTIDDNAGKNYGFLQMNKFGSLQIMKKLYNYIDVDEFFSSPECIEPQIEYFKRYVLDRVIKFGFVNDNDLLTKCDSLVQNGVMTPSRAPRSYDDWQLGDELLKQVKNEYAKNNHTTAFLNCLPMHEHMYAELMPRSGVPKFIPDMLSRRRCTSYGTGKVHGHYYDLSLFGFSTSKY
jgi:hypothetical protein